MLKTEKVLHERIKRLANFNLLVTTNLIIQHLQEISVKRGSFEINLGWNGNWISNPQN